MEARKEGDGVIHMRRMQRYAPNPENAPKLSVSAMSVANKRKCVLWGDFGGIQPERICLAISFAARYSHVSARWLTRPRALEHRVVNLEANLQTAQFSAAMLY